MLVSSEPFTDIELSKVLPENFGHHDATWIRRDSIGSIVSETKTGAALNMFLQGISSMLAELQVSRDPGLVDVGVKPEELDEYTYGTAFYNFVPARAVEGRYFHYDTGFDRPVITHEVDSAVLRFAGSWASDGVNVSYIFSSDPRHYGRSVEEVLEERSSKVTQPDNERIVIYNNATGLHGLAPAAERPGETSVIYSASLYKAHQVPTIIPALAELPRPDAYIWRQCE